MARIPVRNKTRIELAKTACPNTINIGTPARRPRQSNKPPLKRHDSKLLFAVLALTPVALLAQSLAPTPRYSEQTELSQVEEWVLSQGGVESIAPELAAILGVGSDRLPVKLKSYRTSDGISLAFAVSTSPKQEGIVISALKTVAEKMEIYSVGTAWLTDRSLLPTPPTLTMRLAE